MLRHFRNANVWMCRKLSSRLPDIWLTDGNYWFQQNILANGFKHGETVYELGGGSRPWFSHYDKQRLNLTVIGLDIDSTELEAAPFGSYNEVIVADLCDYVGRQDADKVICQATLEHVRDAGGAIRAISTLLRVEGKAYIFVPCGNALFAWLNKLLGQNFKRRLLAWSLPYAAEGHDGFPAPYDRCTPEQISSLARTYGLSVQFTKTFWFSGYFEVFVPAYLSWRMYQRLARRISGDEACESFCLVLCKL